MPYPANPGDIVECQILGRLHGQRTRNVFHYAVRGLAVLDAGPWLVARLADFELEVESAVRAFASNEWASESCTIQLIKPTRFRPIEDDVGQNGGIAFSSLPSGVAAVVSKYAEPAGRHYQGRNYIAGVPVNYENDSMLAANGQVALALVSSALLSKLPAIGGDTYLQPIVTGNVATPVPVDYDVITTVPRYILRYQRRRAIGVGE